MEIIKSILKNTKVSGGQISIGKIRERFLKRIKNIEKIIEKNYWNEVKNGRRIIPINLGIV